MQREPCNDDEGKKASTVKWTEHSLILDIDHVLCPAPDFCESGSLCLAHMVCFANILLPTSLSSSQSTILWRKHKQMCVLMLEHEFTFRSALCRSRTSSSPFVSDSHAVFLPPLKVSSICIVVDRWLCSVFAPDLPSWFAFCSTRGALNECRKPPVCSCFCLIPFYSDPHLFFPM